jgi:hypothetical protein
VPTLAEPVAASMLAEVPIECPLWLDSCSFEQAVLLAETQAKSISLRDSTDLGVPLASYKRMSTPR